MKIETYEVEEIKGSEASTMAADSEAIELAQKLGLKGQLRITNTATATRFPYRRMSALEEQIYSSLFPAKTALEEYDSEPIPLRVLQVAAHVKELDMPEMGYLEVWHPMDAKKDPVLVARRNSYSGDNYILARWGDALQSLDQLVDKAKAIWIASQKLKFANIRRELDADESRLDLIANEAFSTGKHHSVNYSGW